MPSSIYVCQLTTKNILAVVFELTLIQLETERFLILYQTNQVVQRN